MDNVRNFVPQLLTKRSATGAQMPLAWIFRKCPASVPIPASKNQERILAHLAARDIKLTKSDLTELERLLAGFKVYAHKDNVEYEEKSFLDRKS